MDTWTVQVLGEEEALERLKRALAEDEIINGENGETFVALKSWEPHMDSREVAEQGRSFVKHVNGLFRLYGANVGQLKFGGAVRFKQGGGRDFFEEGTVVAKMTASGIEQVIGPDGVPLPPPPDPLVAAIDLARPEANAEVHHALRRLGETEDWYELYNVYEIVKKGLGGQTEVESRIGSNTRSRLTQTMNHYRHADVPLPAQPFDLDSALDLVRSLARIWLDEIQGGTV